MGEELENEVIEETEDPTGGEETPGISAEDAESLAAGDIPPATEKKSNFQKRIDQLTRERSEAERKAAYFEGLAQNAQKQRAPAETDSNELDPDDFGTPAEYHKAVAKQYKEQLSKEYAARDAQKNQEKLNAEVNKQYAKGRKKYEDFDEKLNFPVTPAIFEASRGDNQAEVLYFLGNNIDEVDRISLLPPAQQAKEIGKIEMKLTSKPIKKTTSNAPNPPSTVGGGGSGTVVAKKESEMSRAELHKKWNAERRKELGIT